jgi:ubiquinol-cytochrome c reductase cytochrome b subunit
MFLVAGVITAMGALFHVNSIWLYGPYDVGAATSFSQPDWYIGFLEGSLRLFPPWEIRIGSVVINNLVFSGIIVAGVIFTGLLLVPWIERHFTNDDREHNLLDRPRDAPHRTAAGVAATSFVAVLFLGGAQDIIATTLKVSIGHVTAVLQITAIVLPPIAYYTTYRICRALQTRPGPDRTERAGVIMRDAGGGYREATEREEEAAEAADAAESRVGAGE